MSTNEDEQINKLGTPVHWITLQAIKWKQVLIRAADG